MKLQKILEEIGILKENISPEAYKLIGDWMDEEFDYTKTNQLLNVLKNNKGYGKIYRIIGIPKDEFNINEKEEIYDYIAQFPKDEYSSYSKKPTRYFDEFIGDDFIKVLLSQTSEYYSLYDWFQDNFDDLDEEWMEDHHLGEVENTFEVLAKLKSDFKIEKIY